MTNETSEGPQANRRVAVISALRDQTDSFSETVAPVISELVQLGAMSSPRQLWLAGALTAEMTAGAVQTLSGLPAVGHIWLDDQRSQTFHSAVSALNQPDPGSVRHLTATLAWHLTAIGADQAWAAGYDGQAIVIGHIDTGVAYDHPDIAGQLWDGGASVPHHGWDYLDEDNDPYDGDAPYWHGTHTAGLLVGDGTSGTVTGVAPGAELMILRCVPGYYEDLVAGLQFCLDHGAHLISTSAGWPDPPAALREANRDNAAILLAAGIPWICAVGNGDGAGGHFPIPGDIDSPGDCPHPWYGHGGHTAVISVGAVDAGDQIWAASGLGPTAWELNNGSGYDDYSYPPGLVKPDLVAPGVDITSCFGTSGYFAYTGTSMPTPMVAGAAAILLQADPTLTPVELGRQLETTALDIGPTGRDNQYGAGRLDIPAALAQISSSPAEFFWVANEGVLPLIIAGVLEDVPWLAIAPASVILAPGDSVEFVATFDATDYGVGAYHTTVTLNSNDPSSPHTLTATMLIGDVTGIADENEDTDENEDRVPTPLQPHLLNYPNPFNPRTLLRFTLPQAGIVELAVYDLQGGLVKKLMRTHLAAGQHERIWDGRDEQGRMVPSGVYLALMQGPNGRQASHKLVLMR